MSAPSDPTAELEAVREKARALSDEHRYATQAALLRDALPLARAAGDLRSTIDMLFLLANGCNSTLTPRRQREACVELVALLESEDAARKVAPELDEELYAGCRHWYTSCAYDNLAHATGCAEGYNSEGMYSSVQEGIHKCLETGKTQCVVCFREYAVEVSLAADDLDLATSQALALAQRDPSRATHDRRAVSWKDLGRIHLLRGDLEGAEACFRRGHEVAAEYHDPLDMQRAIQQHLRVTYALMGQPERLAAFVAEAPLPPPAPAGECPLHEYLAAQAEAVELACAGDLAGAAALHERWAGVHDHNGHLAHWFEERTRLAAVLTLAGDRERAGAVAEETAARARAARNWITLRRLAALEQGAFPPSPLAGLAPLASGPFAAGEEGRASSGASSPLAAGAPSEGEGDGERAATEQAPSAPEPDGPWLEQLRAWQAELHQANAYEEVLARIAAELLEASPATVESARDAWAFLTATRWCLDGAVRPAALWAQAARVARRWPEDAQVCVSLARVAELAREAEGPSDAERPDAAEVEALYRKALQLDPEHPGVHYEAGLFHARRGEMGEAERCLARAARLDRTWAPAALALAQVYRDTDRPGAAVDVLALALRSGCDDEDVLQEAGLDALRDGRHQLAATCFEQLRARGADWPWASYYLASALLELGRAEEAGAAAEAAARENEAAAFPALAIRAAAAAAQGDHASARRSIEEALGFPLARAVQLTPAGLAAALSRLLRAAQAAGAEAAGELPERLVTRTLRAGLVRDDWLAEQREASAAAPEEVQVYEVTFDQELLASWSEDPACPPWEQGWPGYHVAWYVLAPTPERAVELAAALQRRCADLPPQLREVREASGRLYHDKPGVVEQSVRERLA